MVDPVATPTDLAPAPTELALADLPAGVTARIVAVEPHDAHRLAVHGLRPGTEVCVATDAPFGGPRIVRAGGARIAVARPIARGIRVSPTAHPDGPCR
jgi:Fe2+ transport system protein FeoA